MKIRAVLIIAIVVLAGVTLYRSRLAAPPDTVSVPAMSAETGIIGLRDDSSDDSNETIPATGSTPILGEIALRVITRDEESRGYEIPADPHARVSILLEQVRQGSEDAAYALFRITYFCSPWIPHVPHSPEELEAQRERIIQYRQDARGRVVENQDHALARLEQAYAFCRYLDRNEIEPSIHWIEAAAELGSYRAMTEYWSVRRHALARESEEMDVQWPEAEARKAIDYLIRARDAGYIDAFFAIAASQAGLIPHGPHERDRASALAHLYAGTELQLALIAQREAAGLYEEQPRLKLSDRARLGNYDDHIERLKFELPPYRHEEARALAERLIKKCCR